MSNAAARCRLDDGAVAALDPDGRRIFEDLRSGRARRNGQAETIFQRMEVARLRIECPCMDQHAVAVQPPGHLAQTFALVETHLRGPRDLCQFGVVDLQIQPLLALHARHHPGFGKPLLRIIPL